MGRIRVVGVTHSEDIPVSRRAILGGVGAAVIGLWFMSSHGSATLDSSASVSVGEPSEPYPDCEVRVDVDAADGELVTVTQVDGYGVTDSVTTSTSGEIVRPAAQGAKLSVVAVDPDSETTSTLFLGEISGVHADECGVSEA